MTKQELFTFFIKQIREYRAALVEGFYCLTDDKETRKRIDVANEAVLYAVRNTNRFSYYSFSDFPYLAYRVVSKKEVGEAEYIGALNRYLERCAETLRNEVSKIMATRKESWNVGTEIAAFVRLSEDYRKLFEANYLSRASIDRKLCSIRRRMIKIYAHPKMTEIVYLKFILMEMVAKPTSCEESTNGLDAALSREAFLVLEKLQQAFKRKLKGRSKRPR